MLPLGGFFQIGDQAHAQRTVGTNRLEHQQRLRIAVDRTLQFGAGVADVFGVDENRRDPGVDHGRLERADTRHFQLIDQIAGGEHRATTALFFRRRIHEFDLHFGRWKGHAVEFEITGFLHFAVGDRHVGNDGLANVGLPHAHHRHAVVRDAISVDQTVADGERTDRCREIAAVAAPVDERLVDRHLAEQVIDVVIGAGAFRQDHGFAGAGRRATHAVDLLVVRVGAADHP